MYLTVGRKQPRSLTRWTIIIIIIIKEWDKLFAAKLIAPGTSNGAGDNTRSREYEREWTVEGGGECRVESHCAKLRRYLSWLLFLKKSREIE